jgi:hypothetical protein
MNTQDYAIITIDVHSDRPTPVQPLLTADKVSAALHNNQPPAGAPTMVATPLAAPAPAPPASAPIPVPSTHPAT